MHFERIAFEGKENVFLDCYVLNSGLKLGQEMARPAVVICPGGGYVYLSPREAEPVALAYAAKGIHAFVLNYSVGWEAAGFQPLKEMDWAIGLIRERAAEWNVDVNKILTCGFSAGGHLALASGLLGEEKPNGVILGYPATDISGGGDLMTMLLVGKNATSDETPRWLNLNKQVTKEAPPLFMFTTGEDVMTRKNISDEAMLKSVASFALDNIGNLLSVNNIANTMINDGRSINVRTVEKYLDGLCESFFLYKASRYDIKGKQYLKTGDKYYVSDLGLRYFMLGRKIGDRGHILENVVYLELLRRGYDVFVGKVDDLEVDFVAINNNGRVYVQVCETLRDNENKILERELNSLRKINDNYEKVILTYDKMPLSNEEGIIVRNVLEWLLDK